MDEPSPEQPDYELQEQKENSTDIEYSGPVKKSIEAKIEQEIVVKSIKKTTDFKILCMSLFHIYMTANLLVAYLKVWCLLYYDDKTATSFTPFGTIGMILGRFIHGKALDNYGVKVQCGLYF